MYLCSHICSDRVTVMTRIWYRQVRNMLVWYISVWAEVQINTYSEEGSYLIQKSNNEKSIFAAQKAN